MQAVREIYHSSVRNTADDSDHWEGQTFQASESYDCVGVVISLHTYGNPAPTAVEVELWSTSAGLPDSKLSSTESYVTDWVVGWDTDESKLFVLWDSPVSLSSGTTYAIVWRGTGSGTRYYQSHCDDGAGYANGQRVYSDDAQSSWTADSSDDYPFYTLKAVTDQKNYQDVSMAAADGDLPAKMYLTLTQANANAAAKMWVAVRTGDRQTDGLWLEGEDADAIVDGTDWNALTSRAELYDADPDVFSGAVASLVCCDNESYDAGEVMFYWRFDISAANIPKGQFRVLARAVVGDVSEFGLGLGYSIGGTTKTLSRTSGELVTLATDDTWETVDLGEVTLPPIAAGQIASDDDLQIRIFVMCEDDRSLYEEVFGLDYIFLLPIDEGVCIVDSVDTTDVLALDSISDPPVVLILDGSGNLQSVPSRTGTPPLLGREDTRIYVLKADHSDLTFTTAITYQPQFLFI
jgi:hypothetical protein